MISIMIKIPVTPQNKYSKVKSSLLTPIFTAYDSIRSRTAILTVELKFGLSKPELSIMKTTVPAKGNAVLFPFISFN